MQISLGQSVIWDAVPSADSYVAELSNSTGVLASFSTTATAVAADTLFAGRVAGNYSIRVKAIKGVLVSAFSEPLSLEFVGLSAPINLRVA